MKKVLIVNHRIQNCGVQQFGRRVHSLVKDSQKIQYFYLEAETPDEYLSAVNFYSPDYIVYNWHRGTMPWLSEEHITSQPHIKHYFLYHEEFTRINYDKYLFFGAYDFSNGEKFGEKKVLLPRPLLEYSGGYPKNEVLTIGSFGFGFWNKGYHTLSKLVNHSFSKVILNLHMPYSHFGDPLRKTTHEVELACRREITNSGVTLNITHDFRNDSEVLSFLAGNDINVFLYEENGEGISSVIDYSLSVKRPIALSESRMFRHVTIPETRIKNYSIREILDFGTEPLVPLYNQWSTDNFRKEFDKEFE